MSEFISFLRFVIISPFEILGRFRIDFVDLFGTDISFSLLDVTIVLALTALAVSLIIKGADWRINK